MIPRRRAMMRAHKNAKNYLFKEGRGLRSDLVYYIYDQNGASGSITDDVIHLAGGNEYGGFILLAHSISWKKWATDGSPVLSSESVDLSNYSTLCVEMKCVSNISRRHSIGVINEEINGQTAPATLQREYIAKYTSNTFFSAVESFYDTVGTRQIYMLDISNVDIGTIAIKCGDSTSMYNDIYNVWLE